MPSSSHTNVMETHSKLPLPEAFLDFLREHDLDSSIYTAIDSIPRYIRLKPGYENEIEEFEAEINCKLNKVGWLPNFYSLSPDVQIASSPSYRAGKLYGIDAASGAAVMALNISPGDHILDLCAAPGAKLCMLLDLLGDSGSVTGVDVAKQRLAACRTMLQKYDIGNHCRLFVADGTAFSLIPTPVNTIPRLQCESTAGRDVITYGEWTSKRPWKERKRAARARERGNGSLSVSSVSDTELIFYGKYSGIVNRTKDEVNKTVSSDEASRCGYDKVLVDAECTHDGSIRHIQKFELWGWQTFQRRVLDAERTDSSLTNLQSRLLSNGYGLLKTGGSLVYSTCSLTVAQNEEVVKHFLLENPSAELQEVEASRDWPCKSGGIAKTLRFDPMTSKTSGLFVAKFTKLAR